MIPPETTVLTLKKAAEGCTACDLYRDATQVVFGEGAAPAPLMLVGEQPGDQEDLSGHPFVGPAGRLLNGVLEEVGLPRSALYITNAVKHFKWEPRGERRIHKKPAYGEVMACKPWLTAETRLVKPHVVVCLGATAAQSFMGSTFRLTQRRGELLHVDGVPHWMATIHPSAVLRMPTDEARQRARADLTSDLRRAREIIEEAGLLNRTGLEGAG